MQGESLDLVKAVDQTYANGPCLYPVDVDGNILELWHRWPTLPRPPPISQSTAYALSSHDVSHEARGPRLAPRFSSPQGARRCRVPTSNPLWIRRMRYSGKATARFLRVIASLRLTSRSPRSWSDMRISYRRSVSYEVAAATADPPLARRSHR